MLRRLQAFLLASLLLVASGGAFAANDLIFGTTSGVLGDGKVAPVRVDTSGQVQLAPAAFTVQVATTRPANTTTFTATDVVGGSPTAVITFANIGAAVGTNVYITSADLRIDTSAVPAGMTSFRLYLYTVTPPSALADNAAWDLPSGDRAAFAGYIDLGTPVDLGSTLFVQTDQINRQIKLGAAETSLYCYLVTNGAYTPAAVSEVYTITLRGVRL